MNKKFKSFLSLFLAVVICCTFVSPAFAAGESNEQGIVFSVTLDKTSLEKSSEDQTVTMRLSSSKPITIASMDIDNATWTSGINLTAITPADSKISSGFGSNTSTGMVSWYGTDVSNITNLVDYTFTVPANTPAGSYTVGIENLYLTNNGGSSDLEDGAYATATFTITEPSAAAGYTAAISTLNSTVAVGDTVAVNVGVTGADSYNAAEVKLSYDSSKLTFNQTASTLGTAKVKAANGVLLLEDYGADKNCGNAAYVLSFTAAADGVVNVGLTSAMFSDKAEATKNDLTPATVTTATLPVTIEKRTFEVTLPDIFEGDTTITDGEDYTFSVADGDNFDYDTVTATVGGAAATVINNGDGTYTVKNVTGALVISGTRTAKSYSVTFAGNGAADVSGAANTATYNQDYSFTMPSATGWAYSLESLTIGGSAYTGYSVQDGVYTIPGAAINGDIVITITKSQTVASVTVEGTGAGAAAGYASSANIGEAYTLTITPVAGYDYTVTATMGGESATVTKSGNAYTIANVTGNIVFTVNQVAKVDGVSVSTYLALDGTNMWLVKNNVTLADGNISTYNGQPMFWSEEYDTYCTLVIADSLTVDEAKAAVGISTGTKVEVDYGMDVNKSGKVDANDAQLIYNMYNAMYSEFTADVTVEKFLRADTNGDGEVNVTDATAVISSLLA